MCLTCNTFNTVAAWLGKHYVAGFDEEALDRGLSDLYYSSINIISTINIINLIKTNNLIIINTIHIKNLVDVNGANGVNDVNETS